MRPPLANDFVLYGIGLASVGGGMTAITARLQCQPAGVRGAGAGQGREGRLQRPSAEPLQSLASDGTASVFITTFNAAPAAGVYGDTVTVLVQNQ